MATPLRPIRVGQRLRRWDGEPGYVDLNSRGLRLYGPDEPFRVCWRDGDSEYLTLTVFAREGVTLGKGVLPWAR